MKFDNQADTNKTTKAINMELNTCSLEADSKVSMLSELIRD